MMLDKLERIQVEKPADIIIRQLRELIGSGELRPGDRLPPERTLAETFGVGRGHVREALKKMEIFGVVESIPKSGNRITTSGPKLLDGLLSNLLLAGSHQANDLLETRWVLETEIVALTAPVLTVEQKEELAVAHKNFQMAVEKGKDGLDEDMSFHLKIAAFCPNSVFRSFLMIVIPEVYRLSEKARSCDLGRNREALKEHAEILEALNCNDPEQAKAAMRKHLEGTDRSLRAW